MRGKGDKERLVPLAPALARRLRRFGEKTRKETDTDRIFISLRRRPSSGEYRPLTTSGLGQMIRILYNGNVVRIMKSRAFVEIVPGKDGFVHISQLADHPVTKVEDVADIGDEITVKVTEINEKAASTSHAYRPTEPPGVRLGTWRLPGCWTLTHGAGLHAYGPVRG